jgi:hypothetical protein
MSHTYAWIARVFRNGDRLFEATKQSTMEAPQAGVVEDMVDHQGKPCRVEILGRWRHINRTDPNGLSVVSFNAELVSDNPNPGHATGRGASPSE